MFPAKPLIERVLSTAIFWKNFKLIEDITTERDSIRIEAVNRTIRYLIKLFPIISEKQYAKMNEKKSVR